MIESENMTKINEKQVVQVENYYNSIDKRIENDTVECGETKEK